MKTMGGAVEANKFANQFLFSLVAFAAVILYF